MANGNYIDSLNALSQPYVSGGINIPVTPELGNFSVTGFNAPVSNGGFNSELLESLIGEALGGPKAAGLGGVETGAIKPDSGFLSGLDNFFNKEGGFNFGGTADLISGLAGLGQVYMGGQQLDLAKDKFDFQKDSFNTNLQNQARLTNAELGDRQSRRVAENPNAISVSDYMAKYGVRS